MKNIFKYASLGLVGMVLTGCAETDIDYFEVTKPQSVADYEYLDQYGSLKDYINRDNTPGFTLGVAASADELISKGFVHRLIKHNFDMMTPGNDMKYASIVANDGTMDFSTVQSLVEVAEAAGIQIYGHTLCWHEQQNTTYLNGLIKDTTDDAKKVIIDAELARWIDGMMKATEGKVKVWDVVNEAISDSNNDNLKHMSTENNSACFYWQDYLGDNYVRNAVKHARESFDSIPGTNAADLKLFVNDYGLEGYGSKKVKSLISWINRWEHDGTRIDGIGTQMHVTYALNPEAQKRNEEGVVEMFKLLAATGKLIRITELDMGIKETDQWFEDGYLTTDMTLDRLKAMGDYYKFIIEAYFKYIPKTQQFGICQWCITDSPANSGWRKGEPVGLWNLSYERKPAYGSFCEALKNATDNN